jgi:hypothetical protein
MTITLTPPLTVAQANENIRDLDSRVTYRTTAQLAAPPSVADKLLDPRTTFQNSTAPKLRYVMSADQTVFETLSSAVAGAGTWSALLDKTTAPVATDNTSVSDALAGKAPSGHGHSTTAISGLDAALSALTSNKQDASTTAEVAQDATAAMFAAGTHSNITFTYNDAAGSMSATAAPGGGGSAGVYRGEKANQADRLATSPANVGDWVIQLDENKRYDLTTAGSTVNANWKGTPTGATLYGSITADTTLVRTVTAPATNSFNRVHFCSAATAITVTATGAQAVQGDFITLDNTSGTNIVTLAGVTARAGYTLVAQAGSIVEAKCTVSGSFVAATEIPAVGGGAARVSIIDQPSFAAIPTALDGGGLATALSTVGIGFTGIGTNTGRAKLAGLRNSIARSGWDGANAANSQAGVQSGNTVLLFEDRPSVVKVTFAVADNLGLGCSNYIGFGPGSNFDPGAGSTGQKIVLGSRNTDSQLSIYSTNAATPAPLTTPLNGGVGFPCNDPSVMYEFAVAYFPTGPRRFVWTVTNLNTLVAATGTISTATAMPGQLELLNVNVLRSSQAIVGVAKIDVMGIAAGAFV